MKTCFTCANSIDPKSDDGRRHTKYVKDYGEFHPLVHFAICSRRNVWLEVARTNCHNWAQAAAHEVAEVSSHPLRSMTALVRRYRYHFAMVSYTALLVIALAATQMLQH